MHLKVLETVAIGDSLYMQRDRKYIGEVLCDSTIQEIYKTLYNGIPVDSIFGNEVDDLCGWAGDFQALIRDYFDAGNIAVKRFTSWIGAMNKN